MEKRRVAPSALLVAALFCGAQAQNPGDSVFAGLQAHVINIEFSQPWSVVEPILKANKENEIYIPARVEINCIPAGNPGCRVFDSVGVRHKGNSTFSQGRQKNPFRLSFDEYGIDQRWDGMKGLVLNNGWGDGAFVREKLHLDVAWRAGVPGPRATFAWLYVNGERYAFYIMLELADKRLLESRFGDKDGDRFKATDIIGNTRRSDFTRRSPFTPQAYHGYYECNSDDTTRAWGRMARFVDTLNLTPEDSIAAVLPRIVAVDDLYRGLGMDVLLGNTDNYIGPAQNFNTYFPSGGGPMRWILWDVSLSFGSSQATASLTRTASSRPLSNRFMNNPELRQDYLRALRFLYRAHFADDWILGHVDSLEAFVLPHLNQDTRKIQSVSTSGFNALRNFINSRRTSVESHFVTQGITEETAIRAGDIALNEIAPSQGWVEVYNNRTYSIDLSGHSLSDNPAQPNKWTFPLNTFVEPGRHRTVRLQGASGTGLQTNFTLPSSGGHLRLSRANGTVVDSASFGAQPGQRTFSRLTDGTGAFGQGIPTPDAANVDAGGLPASIDPLTIVINEFMADNDTITAPAGVKADWVELFNTKASPVDLSGMHLSDNANNPAKWTFPSGASIPANGYLVVWAYDTTFAGSLHASWALSKDGEHIRLSNADLSVVDSVTFGAQAKNRSMARVPNGTGPWVGNRLPTLGSHNGNSVSLVSGGGRGGFSGLSLEYAGGFGSLTVARFVLSSPGRVRLSVHDVRGREVAVLANGSLGAGAHAFSFDASRLPAGAYFFRLRAGASEHVRARSFVK